MQGSAQPTRGHWFLFLFHVSTCLWCNPIIIPTRKEEKMKGNKKQTGRSRFYTVGSYDDVTVIQARPFCPSQPHPKCTILIFLPTRFWASPIAVALARLSVDRVAHIRSHPAALDAEENPAYMVE